MSRMGWLALALFVFCPANAHGWEIDRARAVAEVVWNHPCGRTVPVTFQTAPIFPGLGTARGAALKPACEIVLRSDMTEWNLLCPLVLHEMGHLAGMKHSDNLRSVMHDPPMYDERCDKRGRPYLQAHGVLRPSRSSRRRATSRRHRQ
jgi:hypothetical protein